jgi:hypothetical protein
VVDIKNNWQVFNSVFNGTRLFEAAEESFMDEIKVKNA